MRQKNAVTRIFKTVAICFLAIFAVQTAYAVPIKIVGFGDSITAGWPYIKSDQNGSTVGGYEPPLKSLLNEADCNATVLNYGHPGELSSEGNSRIQSMLNAENPEWVLILEGTNDLFWVSTSTVKNNLARMVNKVLASGSNAVLATLTPDTRGGKPIKELNKRIRGWAKDNEVPLADQYAAVASNWNNLHSGDRLHPNRAGYQVMANTWFNTPTTYCNKPDIVPIIMLLLGT